MKHNLLLFLFLAGILPLLVSCASQSVPLASVGPHPLAGYSSTGETGSLLVFSDREPSSEGDNPPFYQRTDYEIYNAAGKRVSYVDNVVGYYNSFPRLVWLQPGRYTVKARAKDGLSFNIPVLIELDRTTKVHLDKNWAPPAGTPKGVLVTTPGGYPAGWRSDPPAKPTKG